ncbi:MAG: hypothetical protein ACKPB3_00455 [Bacteroidota bacterium]
MSRITKLLLVFGIFSWSVSKGQEMSAINPANAQNSSANPTEARKENTEPKLSAFRTAEGVNLQWNALEPDKKIRYLIESGIDGENFVGNGILEGGKQRQLSFIDKVSGASGRYYRVRTEKDGQTISLSEPCFVVGVEEKPFSMYPNPTNGELFTDLFNDFKGQSMRVIVKDMEGNIQVSKQVPIEDKLSKIKILTGRDGLKPGQYQVSMAFKNRTFSETITVK